MLLREKDFFFFWCYLNVFIKKGECVIVRKNCVFKILVGLCVLNFFIYWNLGFVLVDSVF